MKGVPKYYRIDGSIYCREYCRSYRTLEQFLYDVVRRKEIEIVNLKKEVNHCYNKGGSVGS